MQELLARLTRVFNVAPMTEGMGRCPARTLGHVAATEESLFGIVSKDGELTLEIHLCQACQSLFYVKTMKEPG